MIRTVITFALLSSFANAQQKRDDPFLDWMNSVAQKQLADRSNQLAKIRDTGAAEERKKYVRAKILELIGGLPDYRGPLNVKVVQTIPREGFAIEKIIFESLPQLFVTANVYRPEKEGRYPAVLMPVGHTPEGKTEGQRIASNLALKGFVVLVYDPIGQGERQQAYDSRLGKSIIGGPTDQHFMAGAQSILLGQTFARYRIWDGMRALDYLTSRPDVDTDRIGCTGCSGGGTLTTYISALDPRVKVAAPACYMNSFRTLFTGSVGDSEQSLPNFLAAGLDQSDYVELFAPKPWLILSTEQDFFTPAGAKQVFEEARQFYRIYDAESRIHWVVGPGGHGTPKKVREAIYEWMIRWLKDGKGDPADLDVHLVPNTLLRVTDKGFAGGRDIYEIIRETPRTKAKPEELSTYVKGLIRENTPAVKIQMSVISGEKTAGRKPAVIVLRNSLEPTAETKRLLSQGNIVAILVPQASYTESGRRYIGNWLANTRAWTIGKNLPALRAGEIISVVDHLSKLPDVDPERISARATGVVGVSLLLAGVADSRISSLLLNRTPHSYQAALDTPVHTDLHDAVIPGFALKWELRDLVSLIRPRTVLWVNPTDWNGNVVSVQGPYTYLSNRMASE